MNSIDFFYFDIDKKKYIISFVPSQGISKQATETISFSRNSDNGRIVEKDIELLGKMMGEKDCIITKLVHNGGQEYTFTFSNKSVIVECLNQKTGNVLRNIAEVAEVTWINLKTKS